MRTETGKWVQALSTGLFLILATVPANAQEVGATGTEATAGTDSSPPDTASPEQAPAAAVAVPAAPLAEPAAAPAPAGNALKVTVGGQYRPRFEVDGKTLAKVSEDYKASHRARLKLTLQKGDWLLQIDPQHVLTWGSAPTTRELGTGTVDFHQAYAQGALTDAWRLRVGRQEIVFDDSRLLGNIDWLQQGQSFDGGRLMFADGAWSWDLAGAIIHEGGVRNESLYATRGAWKDGDLSVAGLGYLQYARRRANGEDDFWKATPGARVVWSDADLGLNADLSGYGQFGASEIAGTAIDYQAWMAAARLGWAGENVGSIETGVDLLSGDDDLTDTTVKVFDTLFATNHKWYGWMDYFLNVPVHTKGLGLTDVLVGYTAPKFGRVTPKLVGHWFMTAQDSAAGNSDLGIEVDTQVVVAIADGVKLVGGYSLFLAGDAMVDIGRAATSGEDGHWGWAQLDLQF
jgi:hypothetical protein